MAPQDREDSGEAQVEQEPASISGDSDEFEFGKFDDVGTTPEAETEEKELNEVEDEGADEKKSDTPNQKEKPTEEAIPAAKEATKEISGSGSSGVVEDVSKVETEVCEAFFEWTDSWNKGNLFGYLDAYWDSEQVRFVSETLLNSSHSKGSVVIHGRRGIDSIFTDIFVKTKKQQERYKEKKGVAGMISLRKLIVTPTGTKNAIVFGEHQMEVAGDKRGTSRGGVFTIHVRKLAGQWKIISEHSTALPKK
mmetsp:Transcript_12272/g.16066  ORF Transcript_12272/g.16066 Transcript_12272/m.16066 type:complete len:250 (-) Transcript_12272:78-827(-)|eukprot:CAMPEP_0198145952 /NCGR_PEP_ID=MMETSP1443-20131203/26410_1 /TAXON_ID=186043 /ORGANISM="Entomoneis sp., Strain CCMP2396" /LENGTH=249 /DNA_ID=CAMNT_0043809727 /DNA_START=154 /DNA_END=903 /DNA_ORIENTATION=+